MGSEVEPRGATEATARKRWWRRIEWMRLPTVLAVVIVVVLAAWLATYLLQPQPSSIQFESRRLFIQFLLIVALGGLLGALFQERTNRRERDHNKRQFQVQRIDDLLNRLAESYLQVKKVRRRLRLVDTSKDSDELKKGMFEIDDARTGLYLFKGETRALQELMPTQEDKLKRVWKQSDKMDKYLKKIWDEYEKNGRASESDSAITAFLPQRDSQGASFKTFAKAHRAARRALLEALSELAGHAGQPPDNKAQQPEDRNPNLVSDSVPQ